MIFGGRSTEHAISCVSAGSVLAALDPQRHRPRLVGITRDGRWVDPPPDVPLRIDDGRLPEIPPDLPARHPTELLDGVDVAFPLLHGPYGEDGTLQGLLELAGIPYVGSGVFASAAAMDKHHMKQLLAAAGLPVPSYVVLRRGQPATGARELGLPVFVKPARGGSSIGITRVDDRDALDAAIAAAARHDPKVLVEAAVPGREVECGVLAGADGTPKASVPGEIQLPAGHDFYDFTAKYLDATRLAIPADLPPATTQAVQRLAVAAFEALDCEGLARVDFFVDGERVVVNEVNTMPGFTPTSMYPKMWAASGVDYPSLVARLIDDALRRGSGLR